MAQTLDAKVVIRLRKLPQCCAYAFPVNLQARSGTNQNGG